MAHRHPTGSRVHHRDVEDSNRATEARADRAHEQRGGVRLGRDRQGRSGDGGSGDPDSADYGVNHLAVAPRYGEAEVRLKPWMPQIRDQVFLGCKTAERTKDEAWASCTARWSGW